MSHALLLRFFLSPSFFSVNVALQYLTLYHEHIGITYYLTRRLNEFGLNELRDIWGFVCHLLVSRPSKSRALECFVMDVCERSTHMAMFTLWFMQAHLRDLATQSKDSKSFTICQRILHHCHEVIFEDSPGLVKGPYSTIKVQSRRVLHRKRIKPHVEPAIIGMSLVLAGSPGMPLITSAAGGMALEQGKIDEGDSDIRSFEPLIDDHIVASPVKESRVFDDEDDDGNEDIKTNELPQVLPENVSVVDNNKSAERDNDRLLYQALTQSRKMQEAAQTTPILSTTDSPRISTSVDDPFGQLDDSPTSAYPSRSSPAISNTRRLRRSGSTSLVDAILQNYDISTQRHLLQSHYCRAEVQFILTLENISNRLLVIPKPARVSALRAELTSLNHKLPAEVCMPMWCTAYDTANDKRNPYRPHHRIVRVPPGESVVLNSAERAPYLLLLEVLHDDLDFDPSKRANRPLLKEIVKKDLCSNKSLTAELSLKSRRASTDAREYDQEISQGAEDALNPDSDLSGPGLYANNISESSLTSSALGGDEEVDLVEQVYGEDLSVHQTPDLADSLVLPTPPKNRALDVAAWSKASSFPSSPALTPDISTADKIPPIHVTASFSNHTPQNSSNSNRLPALSLDEYSQRMRTAAVMLSQLNATLTKEIYTPNTDLQQTAKAGDSSSNTSSWLPMSNWLSGISQSTTGPLHPSLSGTAEQKAAPPGGSRMKLQAAEVSAIRERIMEEMLALEEERMERMQADMNSNVVMTLGGNQRGSGTTEDEQVIRRALTREDPSSVVFSESWSAKKSRIRQGSPYGHLANWDCVSVIVKTGGDLRQEQLATQMIQAFERIWKDENCQCWVRPFQILITSGTSGLVETITDAVSIHSIKKALYARRLTEGGFGQASILDHFIGSYGDPSSAKFARAQRNFVRSLAGYSIVTYLLQIKDRHNGNILLDRDGHLIHIDFGFMLSNSPGNIGFEAAPFKLPFEYVEVLGGTDSSAFAEFKRLFHEGFEAARKHCDRIITIVELMQKDSSLPCFAALGEQTAQQLRDRFQPRTSQESASELVDRLIMSSLGSNWTRLYDSYQYYSQSIL